MLTREERSGLTIWGEHVSAQIRTEGSLVVHFMPGAPVSTEEGLPFILHEADVIKLRDVLNEATDRGLLGKDR